MTHRFHSRVRHLERRAKRWPLGKRRWAWLTVRYAPAAEIDIFNDALTELDGLRPAYDAIRERAAKWCRRPENKGKPGMPLTKAERQVNGDWLHCLKYLRDFCARFPHRHEDVPCVAVRGDAELLAKRPADMGLVIWEVFEPVLSPEMAALKAEAERQRRAAEEPAELDAPTTATTTPPTDVPVSQPKPMTPDELRRKHAREAFERQSHPDTRWRGIDHAPHADTEFREARRQRRVDVRELSFFNKPRHNRR